MVNMDIALPDGSVMLFEIETADDARTPIMSYAGLTGSTVPFVSVDKYLVARPFQMAVWSKFIRALEVRPMVEVVF